MPHPTYDDGVTIRTDAKVGEVWMVKKNPGVYFRRPIEGKPLEMVDDDAARECGFDVTAHQKERKIAERMVKARAKVEAQVMRETIAQDMKDEPPLKLKHVGSGLWDVLDANDKPQNEERLSKAAAEELVEILTQAEIDRRLVAAGLDPIAGKDTGAEAQSAA